MRDLVIMPAMAQRRESLNMGEFAEEAIIVEEVAAPKRVNHFIEANTLVDEQGNETLFEILLTIDGREEFGKNYVLLVPAGAEEDANGEIEIQAYSFTENEDGTEGDLQPIPEDSDAEWDMIEEVFNSFIDEN